MATRTGSRCGGGPFSSVVHSTKASPLAETPACSVHGPGLAALMTWAGPKPRSPGARRATRMRFSLPSPRVSLHATTTSPRSETAVASTPGAQPSASVDRGAGAPGAAGLAHRGAYRFAVVRDRGRRAGALRHDVHAPDHPGAERDVLTAHEPVACRAHDPRAAVDGDGDVRRPRRWAGRTGRTRRRCAAAPRRSRPALRPAVRTEAPALRRKRASCTQPYAVSAVTGPARTGRRCRSRTGCRPVPPPSGRRGPVAALCGRYVRALPPPRCRP